MNETQSTTADGERPISHLEEGLILDLLHGLVTGDERRQVVEHMRACPECESLLRARSAEYEELRTVAPPEREVLAGPVVEDRIELSASGVLLGPTARPIADGEAPEAISDPPRPSPPTAAPRRRLQLVAQLRTPRARLGLGLAASVTIALVFLGRQDGGVSSPDYWIPAGREIIGLRSETSNTPLAELRAGIDAYERHETHVAVDLLRDLDPGEGYEQLGRIYLASALVLIDRHVEALEMLDALQISTLPLPWRVEAKWLRCAALVETGKREEARELLDELCRRTDEIGELARELRSRL